MRVGLVGAGYFGRLHAQAWPRVEGVELIGIADRDTAAAQAVAEEVGATAYDDVAAMIETGRLDWLDIATPPDTHLPLIEFAFHHDLPVSCQKPFCGTLDAARKAVDLAKGRTLVVHENFRFQPWYEAVQRALASHMPGPLYQATFRVRPGDGQGARAYLDRQPYFRNMQRFLVHETLVHHVDVARMLFGEVESLWAQLDRFNTGIAGEDAGLIVMTMRSGMRVVIDGNRCADHEAENRRRTMGELSIEGQAGELTLDGDAALRFRAHGENAASRITYGWDDIGFGGDCVFRLCRHLADGFRRGTPFANTAADYLANLEIEDAIYRSAEQGRRIVL